MTERKTKTKPKAKGNSTRTIFAEPVPDVPRGNSNGPSVLERSSQIGIRLGELAGDVAHRETVEMSPSSIVRRDVIRYYAIMDAERRSFDPAIWTPETWKLLRETVAGTILNTPAQVATMWAFVANKFGDTHPLTVELRGSTIAELFAIVDELESGTPDIDDSDVQAASMAPTEDKQRA